MIILLAILLGYLSVEIINPDISFLEKISVGIGIGVGVFTLLISFDAINGLMSASQIKQLFMIVVLTSLSANFFLKKDLKKDSLIQIFKHKLTDISFLQILFFIFIVLVSTIMILWPIHAWDSLTLHDFRANYLLEGKSLTEMSRINSLDQGRESYYFSYPLLSTSINILSYMGGLSNPRVLYLLFSLSLMFIVYKYLIKAGLNKTFALATVLLFISFPTVYQVMRVSYSNSVYLYYFIGSIIFLAYWFENRKISYFLISLILSIFSIQTRQQEPFFLSIILALIVFQLIHREKLFATLVYLLGTMASYVFWPGIKKFLNISFPNKKISYVESIILGFENFSIERLKIVAGFYFNSLVNSYSLVLILFIASLAVNIYLLIKKKINIMSLLFPLIVFSILGILFAGTYFLSFIFERWNQIPQSFQRTALPIIPLTIIHPILIIYSDKWRK